MREFKSVNDILDFAIAEEEAAAEFYTKLASTVRAPGMDKFLLEFAEEEKGHKAKLLAMKAGKIAVPQKERVVDLKIADYTVEIEPTPHLDYAQALLLAMKKEKAAFKLYSDLAQSATDVGLRQVLLSMAQEEAKHKLRFEVEYDDHILTEN